MALKMSKILLEEVTKKAGQCQRQPEFWKYIPITFKRKKTDLRFAKIKLLLKWYYPIGMLKSLDVQKIRNGKYSAYLDFDYWPEICAMLIVLHDCNDCIARCRKMEKLENIYGSHW